MNYQRCNTLAGNQAMARMRSEIMDLMACGGGAKHAACLSLISDPIENPDANKQPPLEPLWQPKKTREKCNLFSSTHV